MRYWPLLGLVLLGGMPRALAHGVNLMYQTTPAMEIQARFDSGEPMEGAQVAVYAPSDPATPWLTGTTDKQGRFLFVPDTTQVGNWEVQVRQAGHGDVVTIAVGNDDEGAGAIAPALTQSAVSPGYSPQQLVLMGAAGVWGFVGTALFFARRRKDAHS